MYFLLIIFVYLWAHTPGTLRLCILWCLSPGHQLEKEGWEQIVAGSPRCSGSPQQMLGVATPCFSWGFDGAPDELWNEGLQDTASRNLEELKHHAFFSVASLRQACLFALDFFRCFCWFSGFKVRSWHSLHSFFPWNCGGISKKTCNFQGSLDKAGRMAGACVGDFGGVTFGEPRIHQPHISPQFISGEVPIVIVIWVICQYILGGPAII